jgi:hypothetical protein
MGRVIKYEEALSNKNINTGFSPKTKSVQKPSENLKMAKTDFYEKTLYWEMRIKRRSNFF